MHPTPTHLPVSLYLLSILAICPQKRNKQKASKQKKIHLILEAAVCHSVLLKHHYLQMFTVMNHGQAQGQWLLLHYQY